MNAKNRDYEEIERDKYGIFLDKAGAFYRTMVSAYGDENWYSVGLEAVHCAISATDALLARRCGIKSTGKDHRDVVALAQEKLGTLFDGQSATLSRIIAMKNQVEYEDRIFTAKEAEEIFKRTDRYFN